MIETNTKWKDSGFDCDHCGGEILQRVDQESGQADSICYQCRECGCQWSVGGDILRVGSGMNCKAVHSVDYSPPSIPDVVERLPSLLSRSLWILLAIIAGAILLRFGGGVVIRFVLPLVLVGIAAFLLVRYGKTQSWW